MKMFLTFTNVSWQKGSEAQVVSFVKEVLSLDNKISIILESHCKNMDEASANRYGIEEIVGYDVDPDSPHNRNSIKLLYVHFLIIVWCLLRKIGLNIKRLVSNPIAKTFMQSDCMVDRSGDSYRDRPGGVAIAHNIWVLSAILLKKPVILV